MKIYVELIDGKLVPVDEHNQELMEDLRPNQWYRAVVSKPRHIPTNSKYFVILTLIVKNSDYFTGMSIKDGVRLLHNEVKLGCGHFDIVHMNVGGVEIVQRIPKSTDFPSTDEIKFKKYFESAKYYLVAQDRLNTEGII